MRGTSIKSYVDDNKVIVKVDVKRYNKGEKVSDYTFGIGSVLVVKPLNKQKLKHRDRRVQVLSIRENERHYGDLRVNVKFLDNNRRGIIEIGDLDAIKG